MATKIVAFFANRNLIGEDNIDWCIYFVETRIFSYAALLLIFFLLLPIARPLEIIVLLLSVLLIRRRSGGYHCKTGRGCFFFSLFTVMVGIFLAYFLEGEYAIQLLLLLFSASPGNDDIAGLYRCNHGFDANKHCIVLCYGSAYCGHFRSCRKIYPKQEVFTMFAKGKVIACVGHTLDKLGEKERKTHKCAVCPIIGFQPRRPERAPTQRDAK